MIIFILSSEREHLRESIERNVIVAQRALDTGLKSHSRQHVRAHARALKGGGAGKRGRYTPQLIRRDAQRRYVSVANRTVSARFLSPILYCERARYTYITAHSWLLVTTDRRGRLEKGGMSEKKDKERQEGEGKEIEKKRHARHKLTLHAMAVIPRLSALGACADFISRAARHLAPARRSSLSRRIFRRNRHGNSFYGVESKYTSEYKQVKAA